MVAALTMSEQNEVNGAEVLAIATQIIAALDHKVACSNEVLIAALKVAALSIEESRAAQFSAQIRANMIMQYRPK